MGRIASLVWLVWLFGSVGAFALPARAQDAGSQLTIPPPPGADTAPVQAQPSVPTLPSAPPDEVVAPLLEAAERDLSADQPALAMARATLVAEALPENRPLRIRADGLRLLARDRLSDPPTAPPLEEVLAPMVAQAELDIRARRTLIAGQRLEFTLSRLPPGTPLQQRAQRLLQIAHQSRSLGQPMRPPVGYAPGVTPYQPIEAPLPERPPPDPDRRGGAEMVELYITASGLGALTGGFIPFAASDQTAGSVTYTLTIIAGAGLFAVGVGMLDLAGTLRTGIAPTISSSIRFGLANGLLGLGVASSLGLDDPSASFALVWGGAALGAVVGLGVGFGNRPRVPEQRFVESVGLWGGGLGTSIAMLTEYRDGGLGVALSLGGLDAGIAAGIAAVAAGARMPIGRTLLLDLGFLAGYGAGIGVPLLYHFFSRTDVETAGLGVGSLVGSVGGWLLLFLLTDGWEPEETAESSEDLRYTLGLAPVEGGAVVSFSGLL